MSSNRPRCTVGVLPSVLRSLPLVDVVVAVVVVVPAVLGVDAPACGSSFPLACRRTGGVEASGMVMAFPHSRARANTVRRRAAHRTIARGRERRTKTVSSSSQYRRPRASDARAR